MDEHELFLRKSLESIDGAESEFANRRYNNCANRCYYACFQAAIAALLRVGVQPARQQSECGHGFVHSRFAGDLIQRRKVFSAALRDTLTNTLALRHLADYSLDFVNEREASRALRRTRAFVDAVNA